MTCRIRKMDKKDISQVTTIDREAFPTMWPPVNFQHELHNRLAHYLVACDGSKQVDSPVITTEIQLVPVRSFLGIKWPFGAKTASRGITPPGVIDYISGFVGLWIMVDEAHIINLAVREICRGNGIGELLMISSIDLAARLKASVVTLEVRASNTIAQNLYNKYGFHKVGLRKGYYADNKEDAYIMTTEIITSDSFKQQFQKLKYTHFTKIGNVEYQI